MTLAKLHRIDSIGGRVVGSSLFRKGDIGPDRLRLRPGKTWRPQSGRSPRKYVLSISHSILAGSFCFDLPGT